LSGTGVKAESASAAVINALLVFYDGAITSGSLYGTGLGKSAGNRAAALRNMIEAAGDLLSQDDVEGAIQQLLDVAKKCDGELNPPDFVAGTAVADFCARVNAAIDALAKPQLGLSAQILFLNPTGSTIADAFGLTYEVNGQSYPDPTFVYAEKLWGTYPLYLPGQTAEIAVNIANSRDSAVELTIRSAAYWLNTDGSSGADVNRQDMTMTVPANAEQLGDLSFILPFAPKGLIHLFVAVYPEDSFAMGEPPALVVDGIFCPPAFVP
jgi:hypothetical protein